MWSAITKIFTKNSNNEQVEADQQQQSGENNVQVVVTVDDNQQDGSHPDGMDDSKQAKQRASVKWLLSKAFNNNVPENLREPFYSDHENQEHLKPQIVRALANAEIYCLALGNIYSDPNYHNLNHNSILQTLARKSVYIAEPSDAQLTETTLIQTNPLRMSAHMAVIESIMVLYAREVVTSDRVLAAVQRFNYGRQAPPSIPENYEKGLLLWMSHACIALRKRIEQDLETANSNGGGERQKAPDLPASVNELKDLVDGVALAALISYYCPDELPWTDLRVSYVPNVQDSLYNLNLVQDFCNRCLPASIFHIEPEDVTYIRDSMKQNLIVFLADLFNVIEIHPAKCVRYPGMERYSEGFPPRNEHGVAHKRNLLQTVITPIPDLRSGLNDSAAGATAFQVTKSTPTHVPLRKTNSCQQSIVSDMSEDSLRRGSLEDSSFVVHRGKNIPTLRSVVHHQQQPSSPLHDVNISNNSNNNHHQSAEVAAGKPSNWEDHRKTTTYAGRRSRRNSTSDDSQLTIENFGGSQDNLNFIGRNPDKELGVHMGRKISAPSFPVAVDNLPVRSSLQDARGSFQLTDNGCEKLDDDTEKYNNKLKRQLSSDDISLRKNNNATTMLLRKENFLHDVINNFDGGMESNNKIVNFAELNKQKVMGTSGDSIQLVYMMQNDDNQQQPAPPIKNNGLSRTTSTTNGGGGSSSGGVNEKKTSFAQLPNNTTTWQQQSSNNSQLNESNGKNHGGSDMGHNAAAVNAAQLNDVRMKLEEKRRLIENEKKRMELAMNKQRQKVGKAAFLQAVAKGRGNLLKTPSDADSNNSATGSETQSPTTSEPAPPTQQPQRPFTLKEIHEDATAVEKKWLDDSQPFLETRKTPDLENMDMEQYQQSIAQMNSSLTDIQSDIQRLVSQQSQIQQQNVIAAQQKQIQQLQQQQQLQQLQQQQQHQYQSMQQQFMQSPPQALYGQPPQQQPQPPPIYQQQQPKLYTSASAPHIPQQYYHHHHQPAPPQPPPPIQQQPQFFLHDQTTSSAPVTPPVVPQRRTWAQQPAPIQHDLYQQQQQPQPEMRTWNKLSNSSGNGNSSAGFILHDIDSRYQSPIATDYSNTSRFNLDQSNNYQNGGDESGSGKQHHLHHSNSFTLSQQHLHHQQHTPYGTSQSTPSASPQHHTIHHQISQLMDIEGKRQSTTPVSLQQMEHQSPAGSSTMRKATIVGGSGGIIHAPIPAPSMDDMEPQNISFIGNADEQQLNDGLSRLNITSGSRTYRIPSPTRPVITKNSFQPSSIQENSNSSNRKEGGGDVADGAMVGEISSLDNDPSSRKGFYITFDDDQPKRPKPPLRTKRGSPKKERSYADLKEETNLGSNHHILNSSSIKDMDKMEKKRLLEMELEEERMKKFNNEERRKQMLIEQERERLRAARREATQEGEKVAAASAIIIDNENGLSDPDLAERMKKRILLASLQRKQEQEEAKARKEQEAHERREREKMKEEEKLRKKEEQAARRAAILEQYKLKKAMEEAEREGKVFDKDQLMSSLKPTPKMRPKAASRPRPKTIHIDSGSVELAEGMMQPSRGKKGSTSNLTAHSTMKRDYYRGSQDSLADRSMSSGMLYRDSPDDSRGVSPCHSANQTLGRRSSYKTSRDPSPAQIRGRPKYNSNYQNFKGRKSSSLMNLYGSSTDQDSLAYRYGDTDSGLGRATPPRRAPSPGMGGSTRHLPSPSGPGSLPGLMSKGRRMFDDGSSDISSTPSSMMDYNGPRLYKQPATKSNRGIMLNAVEYCVFPGVVNREAKRRVLEEINRSESKHFLILFRDAGCQFRALYSYCPDREEVLKLYGTGPKQVNDRMFDKFFKYNSGGKCFSQVHTKHLTVTIDAFTIHNSLWQGKKVNLPNKKDMALVI